jgi:septal ring factor EnvC (AmiA/AmiB activator)
MAPAIHKVNSWLSGRLAKDKKSKETDTSAAAAKRQRTKSPREKRQEDAAVMKANEKASLGDETKQHLFLAKYLGILLIKGDATSMIVTDRMLHSRTRGAFGY